MPPKGSSAANTISKVYLFNGEVDARRASEVDKLISQVIDPGSETFDLERFDGDSASATDVLASAVTLPFSSKRKVVVVDRVDRMSADDQTRIAQFLPKLGDMSCLILLSGDENPAKRKASSSSAKAKESDDEDEESEGENSKDAKKTRKGLQPSLTSAVKKNGSVVTFAKMKARDTNAYVADVVKAHGVKIEPMALQALSHSMQSAPALTDKEVEKLIAYIGERNTITAADVERVTTKSPEDRVFGVIDAVGAGRPDTAIQLLNETFSASTKPDGEVPKVLALLARHFRILYQARFLAEKARVRQLNYVPEEFQGVVMREQSPLSVPDFQKEKLLAQAQHFPLDELRRYLKLVLECELVVKGQAKGSGSPRMNLEMLIIKLCDRKSPSRW